MQTTNSKCRAICTSRAYPERIPSVSRAHPECIPSVSRAHPESSASHRLMMHDEHESNLSISQVRSATFCHCFVTAGSAVSLVSVPTILNCIRLNIKLSHKRDVFRWRLEDCHPIDERRPEHHRCVLSNVDNRL